MTKNGATPGIFWSKTERPKDKTRTAAVVRGTPTHGLGPVSSERINPKVPRVSSQMKRA